MFNDYIVCKLKKKYFNNPYSSLGEFHEGLVEVENQDGLWGYMDDTGKEVIPCKYEYASMFSKGTARVKTQEGLLKTINKKGIICNDNDKRYYDKPKSYYLHQYYYNELVKVQRKYRYISYFSEGYACVENAFNLYGFIDKTGNEISSCKYKNALYFKEGLAPVKNDEDLWGYIDYNGKEVIPCIYEYVGKFHNGLALVQNKNGLYGCIDKTGNEVIPCIYLNNKGCQLNMAMMLYNNPQIKDNLSYISEEEIVLNSEDDLFDYIEGLKYMIKSIDEITYCSNVNLYDKTICISAKDKKELNNKKLNLLNLFKNEITNEIDSLNQSSIQKKKI